MQRHKPESTTALLLGENMMKYVPRDVGLYVNLTVLHLNRNNLSNLPDVMASLTKLVTLFADQNGIKQIPGWIGTFAALKHLNLESNFLTALPKEMGNLRKLETLRLLKNAPLPGHICKSVLNDHAGVQNLLADIVVRSCATPVGVCCADFVLFSRSSTLPLRRKSPIPRKRWWRPSLW